MEYALPDSLVSKRSPCFSSATGAFPNHLFFFLPLSDPHSCAFELKMTIVYIDTIEVQLGVTNKKDIFDLSQFLKDRVS